MAESEHEQLGVALREIRESLQADHADLEVLGVDGRVGRVRLVIGPSTCQECIMPKAFLEEMMLMQVQEKMPQIGRVELDDPRPA